MITLRSILPRSYHSCFCNNHCLLFYFNKIKHPLLSIQPHTFYDVAIFIKLHDQSINHNRFDLVDQWHRRTKKQRVAIVMKLQTDHDHQKDMMINSARHSPFYILEIKGFVVFDNNHIFFNKRIFWLWEGVRDNRRLIRIVSSLLELRLDAILSVLLEI